MINTRNRKSMIYIDCGNGNENDFDVELAEKLQDMLTEEQSKEINYANKSIKR